ncbi:MAG: preprotein translocase subunit SecE [Bifidobacteriaceae bacterium]|nr:preprotein translocase subunit SecE [Bifidobacteriaceae bacterium]
MSNTAAGAKVDKVGAFARLVRFVRQIVSELSKVVRPTRQELFTYASVVLVFVLIVMAFIWVVDFATQFGIEKLFS